MFVYFLYVLSLFVYFYLYLYFSLYLYLRSGWRSDSYPFPWLGGRTPQYKGAQCCPPPVPLDNRMRTGGGRKYVFVCFLSFLCVYLFICVFLYFSEARPNNTKGAQNLLSLLVPQDNWMRREQMWRMYIIFVFSVFSVCVFVYLCVFLYFSEAGPNNTNFK